MNIAISRKINFLPTETPSRVVCALVAVLLTWVTCLSASMADKSPDSLFVVQVNAAEADVLKAVEGVSEDQIVHGTFSYEKERTLYGAHASNSAPAFGSWDQPGKAFYKIASGVLAPRFFKDSGDIGTISVRYVVQAVDASTTNLRIDALFVDARNVKHASKGSVEAAEYGAIQERMRSMQADRKDTARAEQEIAAERAQTPGKLEHAKHGVSGSDDSWALGLDVPQLEQRVAELRHDAELEVKDPGGSLKAAPFRAAATLASLPGKTEVVVVVLTPFWYGVQTEDGHRGWIHRSEVEPLE
jgi:hypothetical protein